jgi:2-oxopent-4-enoate hydratase
MMTEKKIQDYAQELYDAEVSRKAVPALITREEPPTIDDAYQIQLLNVQRKKETGKKIIGKKIGLTSLPMQKMLGVFEPDYGHLFESMLVPGHEVSLSTLIQPKAEGELAFIMNEDLRGPGITPYDVIRATGFVLPAIEIIDSRVENWKIKIEDTIADNASSGLFLTGDNHFDLKDIDMFTTGMVFIKNGEVTATGTTAEVMGNPVNAVVWLINKLGEFGVGIEKGEIILSGSLTGAVEFSINDTIEIVFDKLGPVFFKGCE